MTISGYYEPELGQSIFGQPYGDLECPEYVEALVGHLSAEVRRITFNEDNKHPIDPGANEGSEFICPVFEMRSYYWGECTCGWDEREEPETHTENCWSRRVRAAREAIPEVWGEKGKAAFETWLADNGWPKDKPGCLVFCDCGGDARFEAWFQQHKLGPDGHRPDCRSAQPNFSCDGFEVRWYKYLGRGMSMNREITPAGAVAIFDKCVAYLRERDSAHMERTLEAR